MKINILSNRNLYGKGITFGMKKEGYLKRLFKCIVENKSLYLMIIPVLAYYIIFCYKPMYGAIIAFKDYNPFDGVWGSPWVGLRNFKDFFEGFYFGRVLKNTLTISITSIIFGFPAPIILALLINELKNKYFTKIVQTVSYMPHFISLVVVCSLIRDFTMDNGVITQFFSLFGYSGETMLAKSELFVPIYVISGIWQEIGWGSIIYLAALTGIEQEMYEAATIDGAGRWKQTIYITIPALVPTIMVMLILRMGGIMNVGFEKVLLLHNPSIYETADVISTYVYRKGIQEFSWSFSSAVGLFNSVINFLLIMISNYFSKKVNNSNIW